MVAAVLDRKPLAQRNALRMGLSEEMKDCFTHSTMLQELTILMTVSQKWENLIPQHQAENASQNKGQGTGFATAPRPHTHMKGPDVALA